MTPVQMFVLRAAVYYEGGYALGVYSSLDAAKAAAATFMADNKLGSCDYLDITPFEVDAPCTGNGQYIWASDEN